MSEISNVCRAVEGDCLQVMKIVHHVASGRYDWLIFEHHSVHPLKEAISILSGEKIHVFSILCKLHLIGVTSGELMKE